MFAAGDCGMGGRIDTSRFPCKGMRGVRRGDDRMTEGTFGGMAGMIEEDDMTAVLVDVCLKCRLMDSFEGVGGSLLG